MKHQAGFTLIELLIVLSIIGIISAIAIPALLSQRDRARMQTTKDNTVNVVTDLVSVLDSLSDPPSERRAGLATTDFAGDLNALATEAVREVLVDNVSYATAKNPYGIGLVYYGAVAAASGGSTLGNVYVDASTVNASTGGSIKVTGNFRDAKGNYQQTIKDVAVN